MNMLSKKTLRIAAMVMVSVFAMTLISSPAFCRGGYSSWSHHGSGHVRVVGDAGILPAIIATGIIAGVAFSLIDSATRAPASRCYAAPQRYYSTPQYDAAPQRYYSTPQYYAAPQRYVAPQYYVTPQRYVPVVPAVVSPPIRSAGSVVVTAELLNVRSGPALSAPSVRQIPNGTVLSIVGDAPGWYFVKAPDNLSGWVMTQYTAPLGYSVSR